MEFSTLPDTFEDLTRDVSMPDPGTVRSHHPTGTPVRTVTEGEQAALLYALSAVPDPRSPRGLRYPLAGLLAVAVCAVAAGASSVTAIADWLHDLDDIDRARLGFPRGVHCFTDGLMSANRLPEVTAACIYGYLQGLADGGWRGSADAVRLAIAASGVAKYIWFGPNLVGQVTQRNLIASSYSRDGSGASAVERAAPLAALIVEWSKEVLG